MQHAEIGETDGELTIGTLHHVEHEAVSGAVHGFQPVHLFVLLDEVHVLFVFEEVSGHLPEFLVVDVRGDDLAVSSNTVFLSHEFLQAVVDDGALWEEEGTAWG